MNTPSTVSIIIVSWNAQRYLVQCLESLIPSVSRYSLEIIVVDNASTDGSWEVVQKDYPQVRLIRNESNLGFSKANNLGIAQSTGRYLALVNSDVKVLGDCISQLVGYLETHPKVGMVGPRIIGGDGRLQRSCRGFPSMWNMLCRGTALDTAFPKAKVFSGYALLHWKQEDEREVDILSGCFWVARREAVDQVGGLDEKFFMYGEDMDWCKRFWARGWKLAFVPSAEAVHYGGASSSNAPVRFYIERQRADIQYWRKHHSPSAAVGFRVISAASLLFRIAGYIIPFLVRGKGREVYLHKIQRSKACLAWLFSGRMPN